MAAIPVTACSLRSSRKVMELMNVSGRSAEKTTSRRARTIRPA